MRFLADMGVSQRVVRWLREAGHDATHLRDEGLHRLLDGDIFTKAAQEQRIILTWDLDFAEILALSGRHTVSPVVFRLMNTRTDDQDQRRGQPTHLSHGVLMDFQHGMWSIEHNTKLVQHIPTEDRILLSTSDNLDRMDRP